MNFGQAQDVSSYRRSSEESKLSMYFALLQCWTTGYKVSLLIGRWQNVTTIAFLVKYLLGHTLKPKKLRMSRKWLCFCLMITSNSTETLQGTHRVMTAMLMTDFVIALCGQLHNLNRCLYCYKLAVLCMLIIYAMVFDLKMCLTLHSGDKLWCLL